MATYSPILGNPYQQYFDANGAPYVGMRLFFYQAGTSTKQNTVTDSTGAVTNTNPVVLDASGFPASSVMIYGDDSFTYKIVAAAPGSDDPPTSSLWTIDNIETSGALITNLLNTTDATLGDALVGTKQTTGNAVARTVHAKLGDFVNAADFGDITTDIGAAINNAITDGFYQIKLPGDGGTYPLLTNVALNVNGIVIEGGGSRAIIIEINADVIGFDIQNQWCKLKGFSLTTGVAHTQVGIQVGDATTGNGARTSLEDLYVDGMGSDGIQIRQGNLGSIKDVTCLNNGGNGINFTDETANNNAWGFSGFVDLRANTGNGLYLQGGTGVADANASRQHYGGLIVTQNNTGDGVLIESKANMFFIYSEANTGTEINLDILSQCNRIFVTEGGVTDSGTGNLVIGYNSGAANLAFIESLLLLNGANGMRLGNQTFTGTLDFLHTSNANFAIQADNVGSNQILTIENINASYFLNMVVDGYIQSNNHVLADTSVRATTELWCSDGVTAPSASVGWAKIYVDTADGDLKVKFGDGTTKTIVTDT